MEKNILLIIPDKEDEERDALANVWISKYGDVLRISGVEFL